MHVLKMLLMTCVLWQVCSGGVLLAQEQKDGQRSSSRIFLIGNSLTWDTLPGLLDGQVSWHVDCGKNLRFIAEHPENPCVKTSKHWNEALEVHQFDVITVQPHFGTTLEQDVEVISSWLKLQPSASLVIHTGWNRHRDFHTVYHAKVDGHQMTHAPSYFERLEAQLAKDFPRLKIRTTGAIDALDSICHDISGGTAPLKTLADLYRDDIHMTTQGGRYLMHNLMRIALAQPRSEQGFQLEQELKSYLDGKLDEVQKRKNKSARPRQ